VHSESLVALTDSISAASAFAGWIGDEVQANQEMIGIGTANIAAWLFQGFPVSTSGSRTAVAQQSGAKTRVTGLVGAAMIVLMLVAVPGVIPGIAVAVGLSILNVFRRSWWTYSTRLGRAREYHNLCSYPGAEQVEGLVVFRFDAPLFLQMLEHSASRFGRSPRLNPNHAGLWLRRNTSRTSTRRRPTCSRTSMKYSTGQESHWCSPR